MFASIESLKKVEQDANALGFSTISFELMSIMGGVCAEKKLNG